jgi:hypothetical protein
VVKYKGQLISKPFSHNIELVNGATELLDDTQIPLVPILPRSPALTAPLLVGKQLPCSPGQTATPGALGCTAGPTSLKSFVS